MDVNQPDGGIVVLQKCEYPIVQQMGDTGSPHDIFSREIPEAPEEICIPARRAHGSGTLACPVYRSIRQPEDPCRG